MARKQSSIITLPLSIFLFLSVFTAVFLVISFPHYRSRALLTSAKYYANATVVDYSSSLTVNGENMYRLYYEFEVNGGTKSASTTQAYTLGEAKNLMGKTIAIKYNDRGDSVAADYKPAFGIVFIMIFSYIVMAVQLVALFFIIKNGRRIMFFNRLQQSGKAAKARVIDIKSYLQIGNAAYYRIKYDFTNDDNQTITAKSPALYNADEAFYLKGLGEIEIKRDNLKSMITEDLSKAQGEALSQAQNIGQSGGFFTKIFTQYIDKNAASGENGGGAHGGDIISGNISGFGASDEIRGGLGQELFSTGLSEENAELFKALEKQMEQCATPKQLNDFLADLKEAEVDAAVLGRLSILTKMRIAEINRKERDEK